MPSSSGREPDLAAAHEEHRGPKASNESQKEDSKPQGGHGGAKKGPPHENKDKKSGHEDEDAVSPPEVEVPPDPDVPVESGSSPAAPPAPEIYESVEPAPVDAGGGESQPAAEPPPGMLEPAEGAEILPAPSLDTSIHPGVESPAPAHEDAAAGTQPLADPLAPPGPEGSSEPSSAASTSPILDEAVASAPPPAAADSDAPGEPSKGSGSASRHAGAPDESARDGAPGLGAHLVPSHLAMAGFVALVGLAMLAALGATVRRPAGPPGRGDASKPVAAQAVAFNQSLLRWRKAQLLGVPGHASLARSLYVARTAAFNRLLDRAA